MKVLVTGGAGFIGRHVVKKFIREGHDVWVIDNLSNGSRANLEEFLDSSKFHDIFEADITHREKMQDIINDSYDLCVHLAAQINVQYSLDNPEQDFLINVVGTHNILTLMLKYRIKTVVIGTCMVYDMASADKPISEVHPTLPKSPYAASKLTAENLVLSYYHGLGLPVVVLRPFNVYGPFQKSNMEGGVVSVFLSRFLKGEDLQIYGDGTQTRDLLYVDDCADFIYLASTNKKAEGEIINAGLGSDISINDLALMICDESRIKHVEHIHPQSEIKKLVCDNSRAERLLGWRPKVTLKDGIQKTKDWLVDNQNRT